MKMMATVLHACCAGTLLLLLGACSKTDDDPDFRLTNPSSDSDGDTAAGDSNDPDSKPDDPTPETGMPPDSGGQAGEDGTMDEPGDIAEFSEDENISVVLNDVSGDSNKEHEFFAVIVNISEEDEQGFLLNYYRSATSSSSSDEDSAAPGGGDSGITDPGKEPPPYAQSQQEPLLPGGLVLTETETPRVLSRMVGSTPTEPAPPPSLSEEDVGSATDEFSVVSNIDELEECSVITAKLWGLGEYVAIWVDEEVNVDADYDCDGVVDQPASGDAYGFTNCDLATVADIFDHNIAVNLREVFGTESDINNDGKIAVVISPVINALPSTSEDDDLWDATIGSYADPEVDLEDFNYDTNPCSNEQEVIYVFAPDPYGLYNSFKKTTIEEYTSMELAGQIARSYLKLIAYNQRVLERDGEAEEMWLVEVLAAMAADYVGFGAIFHPDAWDYLDAPHLSPLVGLDDDSLIGVSKGAQYLFGRWLVDTFGASLLADMTQTDQIGIDNVEAATGEEFKTLVVQWQVALFASGYYDDEGSLLVDSDSWPLYSDAEFLSASDTTPDTPTAGFYYGANGYQRGFNIRGENLYMESGTTTSPTENVSKRVFTNGTDSLTYVPGYNYYGYITAGYTGTIVRLADLDYDSTSIEIQGAGSNLVGAIIRWEDPESTNYAVEKVFSPTEVATVDLPALPSDGSDLLAIGDISDSSKIQTISEEEAYDFADVYDTDRWRLDLSDQSGVVQLAIWLQRPYSDYEGSVDLEDPWFAIVPESDLPTPDVTSTQSGDCDEGATWGYPSPVLDTVYYQYYLSTYGYDEGSEAFSPCSSSSEDSGLGSDTGIGNCFTDWDGDGTTNSEEPAPDSFFNQIMVYQCDQNGGTLPAEPYSTDFIDSDEMDTDDEYSFSTVYDIGGRNSDDGEGGYLVTAVDGGQPYVIVVGGNANTGSYQMRIRRLN